MSSGVRAIVLTLVLAACVYLFGNARVQLWDRDEPRYAQCSRQMLQSGDWVVPRLYDKLRFQKPPLIYWCQAASMRVFGSEQEAGAFAARLPSTLAVLLTLTVLGVIISRHSGTQQGAWTVFVFATSAMTLVAAKSCLTDGVLVLFITVAQLCLFAIWNGSRSWLVVVALAVSVGLGLLTKGPFILGILLATGAALGALKLLDRYIPPSPVEPAHLGPVPSDLDRSFARPPAPVIRAVLQAGVGLAIVAAIVLPWIRGVMRRAPDFLPMMLHEGRQHTLEGKEGHHLPPGYHLVLVWAMFMPWSLLLPLAMGVGFKLRGAPKVRFALAAVVGPWVMVEFMGTKLPHYFLPAYPALAYLTAVAILRCIASEAAPLRSRAFHIGTGVWAAAIIVIAAAPFVAAIKFQHLPWPAMSLFFAVGTGSAIVVFVLLRTNRFKAAFVGMGMSLLLVISAGMLLLAQAPYVRLSTRAASRLRELGAIEPGSVKMVDYKEPSLAFYQGGTIREVEKKGQLIFKPIDEWPRWVVITRDAWKLTPPATRAQLRVVSTYDGLAYADSGRVVELMIVENTGK